jgi:hypothetical protein
MGPELNGSWFPQNQLSTAGAHVIKKAMQVRPKYRQTICMPIERTLNNVFFPLP